jgi:hypothetical protein
MRVNKTAPLGAFVNNVSEKAPKKMRTGNAPLALHKDPDAPLTVPPPQMNLWERPVYVPNNDYVRPGANDHQRIKSRGL